MKLKDCLVSIGNSTESLAELTEDEFEQMKPGILRVLSGKTFNSRKGFSSRNYSVKDVYMQGKIIRMYVEEKTSQDITGLSSRNPHLWMSLSLHLEDKAYPITDE